MKVIFDEHFSDRLAQGLRRQRPEVDATSIHAAGFDGLPDDALLAMLDVEKAVLVTRDATTIMPELHARLESGLTHGGIVFVPKSIAQADERTVLRRLGVKLDEFEGDWSCRVVWL